MQPLVRIALLCAGFQLCVFTVAAESSLKIREAVNVQAISFTQLHESASSGKEIAKGDVVQTGVGSRLDLSWGKKTTIRIGSKGNFQLAEEGAQLNLKQGGLLFENARDGYSVVVQAKGQEIIVHGDIGFVQLSDEQPAVFIGTIAGRTKVQANGKTHHLKPGEMLVLSENQISARVQFDLEKQAKTSLLLNGFKKPLTRQAMVEKEAKRYATLRQRGFVLNEIQAGGVFPAVEPSILAIDGELASLVNSSKTTLPSRNLNLGTSEIHSQIQPSRGLVSLVGAEVKEVGKAAPHTVSVGLDLTPFVRYRLSSVRYKTQQLPPLNLRNIRMTHLDGRQ